ncbi:MAG: hypothetical protein F2743_09015 [Actinobacteria bacterium]|nr:hypothetical protein [Actinomycetota bacterium]
MSGVLAPRIPSREKLGHVAVLNFTGDRSNWGSQATSWELLRFLHRAFRWDRSTRLTLLPLLPRHAIDREIEDNSGTALLAALLDIVRGKPSASSVELVLRVARIRYGGWIDQIADADIFFFQGEGTMAGTDFVRGMRLLLLPIIAKHIWRKPVLSLNQTLFSADEAFTELLTESLRSFDLIGCREMASYAFARSLGLNEAVLIPDMAFNAAPFELGKAAIIPSNDRYFCLVGSALRAESNQARAVVKLARRIIDRTGMQVFVAGSVGADLSLTKVARKMLGEDKVAAVDGTAGYQEFAETLRQCAFLLGGRYHSAIAAATVGTPYIPTRSNTYKTEGLNALLDWPFEVREIGKDDDAILADVDRLCENRSALRLHLNDQVFRVRETLRIAEDWLRGIADGESRAVPPQLKPAIPASLSSWQEIAKPYIDAARRQTAHLKYSTSPDEEAIMGKPVDVAAWPPEFAAQ